MKVLELINKLDDLKDLRDDLQKRANADDLTGCDSDLMDRAADAIYDYIQELYQRDIKV